MASTARRLAAILAADIAGYSRLVGADEVGTVEALREHRSAADPLIAQHGGRIVKTTGDGVLIEFGSVVGAVECALALQQLAEKRNAGIDAERRMEWRIGIHLATSLLRGTTSSATASISPRVSKASPNPAGSASPRMHFVKCAARSRRTLPISASRA